KSCSGLERRRPAGWPGGVPPPSNTLSPMLLALLFAFLAGFGATILCHQPVFAAFHRAGVIDRKAYDMSPVPPLGVPSVISLAFWGGLWGLVMIPIIGYVRSGWMWWLAAGLFGAILPTIVAGAVVAPIKKIKLPRTPGIVILGLAVNAAWGLGTAALYRVLI